MSIDQKNVDLFSTIGAYLPVVFDITVGPSGGGKLGDNVWAASMLTLENGTIRMLTIDNSGNTLMDKTITA